MRKLYTLAACLFFSACASQPESIPSASVSSLQYHDYTCKQIAAELERTSKKANDLYFRLDKKAGDDAAQMGVGLVLFWPALFFLEGGDGPEAAECAQMKGTLEALEDTSIKKNCNLSFPETPKPKKKETKKNEFQQ